MRLTEPAQRGSLECEELPAIYACGMCDAQAGEPGCDACADPCGTCEGMGVEPDDECAVTSAALERSERCET